MHSARDDYLLRSRWGHVPRTPRAGPRPGRSEFAQSQASAPASASRSRGLLARLSRRPQGRGCPGELDIHAYLELEFAVEDEWTATR